MRSYQENIISSIVNKTNWGGNNVAVTTTNNVTKVAYYGNVIGYISHVTKTCKCDDCGYKNTSTTARINAIKTACKKLGYKVFENASKIK